MKRIYCASGFQNFSVMKNLIETLRKDSFIKSSYEFIVPLYTKDDLDEEFVFSDIFYLESADILIVRIDKEVCSIGATMELAWFRSKKPMAPIICYKCMKHSWINKLSSFMLDNPEDIRQVLLTIYNSKKILHS